MVKGLKHGVVHKLLKTGRAVNLSFVFDRKLNAVFRLFGQRSAAPRTNVIFHKTTSVALIIMLPKLNSIHSIILKGV